MGYDIIQCDMITPEDDTSSEKTASLCANALLSFKVSLKSKILFCTCSLVLYDMM